MATKIFLDTNIVIDFFDPLRPGHLNAKKLLSKIEDNETSGYVSESVANTVVYLLRKQFSPSEIRKILYDFLSIISILPCTTELYLQSLKFSANDIEDAVLYQLAIASEIDYFVTENKKDFKKFSMEKLPVITTREFLKTNP